MINPDRNLYEPPYDDALLYESDLEPERPRSRPLVVLLGIVVLAAFAGVVWVAYNQGVKQGQRGTPPILTADAGPTRISPDPEATGQSSDPAPDKSYDRLLGEAPEQEDNILPAPEQPRVVPAPQELASNESSESTGGPFQSKASDIAPPVDPRMDATVGVENLTPSVPSSSGPSARSARSEDISEAITSVESAPPPVSAPRQLTPSKPSAAKPATIAQAEPPKAAVATPAPRAAEVAPPPAETSPVETKMAALPPAEAPAPKPAPAATGGSVMIQLGSFPNDGLAASAWSKIKMSNQELLGSYSPMIKSADIPGKGTWYRLRVGGFADKSAAQSVCEQLKATGQACILALK